MKTPRKVETAQALIEAGRYDEARILLNSVKHPAAEELNRTLNGRTTRPMITQPPTFTMPQFKTKLRWIDRFFPHAEVDPRDPLFRYEVRNLPYGKTLADLKSSTLRWMSYILFPMLGIWLAFALATLPSGDFGAIAQILLLAFGLSLLDKFVLDFSAVMAGLDTVRRDITEGRWDLICLTDISAKRVTVAKYTAIQIRAWRIMTFVIAFRLGISISAVLTFIVLPILREPGILGDIFEATPAEWLLLVGSLGGLLLLMAGYVIEPRWRLRTLAAGSLMISTRAQENTFAVLSAMWIIFRIWLLQILMAFGSMIMMWIGGFLFTLLFVVGVSPLLFSVAVSMFVRSLYQNQTTHWLSSAYRRLLVQGGAR